MNSDKNDKQTEGLHGAQDPPAALWPETGSSRVVVDVAAVSDRGLVRDAASTEKMWARTPSEGAR